jgi:thioredoxin 1
VPVLKGQPLPVLAGRIDDSDLRAWMAHLVEGGPQPKTVAGPGMPATASGPLYTNGRGAGGATGSASSGASAATDRPTTGSHPLTLSDANFQQVVSGPGPVLVDFWAEWCGPCRMVAPSVDALAQEFAGRAVVGKLNVDENPKTAMRYNIMSIPALFIFKNGQVVEQVIGAQPLPVLRAKLAQYVQ